MIPAASVAQQAFDTEIFGLPYHRVVELDQARLERELPPLLARKPIIIDAKVPAERTDLVRYLLGHGFRAVCPQITLVHDLAQVPLMPTRVAIRPSLAFDAETIRAHAANFLTDRFACDPLITAAEHDRLYARWIENSLAGRMQVAVHGRDFCSFRLGKGGVTIDLLSVLDKGRGIGRDLVDAVVSDAARQGSTRVSVVTECGNEPAWRLYLGCGFRSDGFSECLHYVAR